MWIVHFLFSQCHSYGGDSFCTFHILGVPVEKESYLNINCSNAINSIDLGFLLFSRFFSFCFSTSWPLVKNFIDPVNACLRYSGIELTTNPNTITKMRTLPELCPEEFQRAGSRLSCVILRHQVWLSFLQVQHLKNTVKQIFCIFNLIYLIFGLLPPEGYTVLSGNPF